MLLGGAETRVAENRVLLILMRAGLSAGCATAAPGCAIPVGGAESNQQIPYLSGHRGRAVVLGLCSFGASAHISRVGYRDPQSGSQRAIRSRSSTRVISAVPERFPRGQRRLGGDLRRVPAIAEMFGPE